MDTELMLDVGQANELKLAFRRNGWSNEEIKSLCSGDILGNVRQVILGQAEIKPVGGRQVVTAKSAEQPMPTNRPLQLITTVSVPAVEAFSAKRCFVTRNTPDDIKLGWIGENFTRVFLNGAGHKEIDVPASEFRIHRLRKWSKDEPIIRELGGEEIAETYLAHMWEMMKRQGRGQQGDLLVNGYANIFYIRASDGVLWAVDCRWVTSYEDWNVEACPMADPRGWRVGDRVVSR